MKQWLAVADRKVCPARPFIAGRTQLDFRAPTGDNRVSSRFASRLPPLGHSMVGSPPNFSRREFLQTTVAAAAGAALIGTASLGSAAPTLEKKTQKAADTSGKGRIYKAVKWGMIADGGSVLEKFQLQKEL